MGGEPVQGAVLAAAGLGRVEVVSEAQELRRGGGGGGGQGGQRRADRHEAGGVAVTPGGEHGACNVRAVSK